MRGKKNPKGHYVTQPSARREGYLNQELQRGIYKSAAAERDLKQLRPRGIFKSAAAEKDL